MIMDKLFTEVTKQHVQYTMRKFVISVIFLGLVLAIIGKEIEPTGYTQ